MIIPVRCISCGTPVAGKWEEFKKEVAKGRPAKKVLDELGINRYCCRTMFLTQIDLSDQIARYKHRTIAREEKGELKESAEHEVKGGEAKKEAQEEKEEE